MFHGDSTYMSRGRCDSSILRIVCHFLLGVVAHTLYKSSRDLANVTHWIHTTNRENRRSNTYTNAVE